MLPIIRASVEGIKSVEFIMEQGNTTASAKHVLIHITFLAIDTTRTFPRDRLVKMNDKPR